jgi:heme exporter protein C
VTPERLDQLAAEGFAGSNRRWLRVSFALDVLTIPLITLGLYLAFLYAPTAIRSAGGEVQRIFYFHVPFAMASFLGFAVVLVTSILFLMKGNRSMDTAAAGAAEVGLLCCTIVLLTGPIWARYAWGVWWTWDARLTSTLVLWLIYAAYLLLRTYMSDDARMRRYAAVLGIIGALDVPIVYFSVHWFRTQHPTTFITEKKGLPPEMGMTLGVGMIAVLVLFAALLTKRLLIGRIQEQIEHLRSHLETRE